MSISKNMVETLLDLVEVKLSYMQVSDREDQRELAQLENCRRVLRRRALILCLLTQARAGPSRLPRGHVHAAPDGGAFADVFVPAPQMRRFLQIQFKPFMQRDPR